MIKLNGRPIQFEQFPNGETKMIHETIHVQTANKIFFKYENDRDLIELMFVKQYLDNFITFAKAINQLTIAYMPYSRMDRSELGSPFTLKYVTNLINQMNFDDVTVIEPHSDVTCALLNKSRARYINFELIQKVKKEIEFNEEYDYIMFPDAGAAKRYSKMQVKNIIIGNKKRDFVSGKIEKLELISDFNSCGNKVIIVDDLSSYGGTFVQSAKALRKEDFDDIYLLVAHAENSIFKGELFDHINKIFTTDSILTGQKFENQLKIYDLEELLK